MQISQLKVSTCNCAKASSLNKYWDIGQVLTSTKYNWKSAFPELVGLVGFNKLLTKPNPSRRSLYKVCRVLISRIGVAAYIAPIMESSNWPFVYMTDESVSKE